MPPSARATRRPSIPKAYSRTAAFAIQVGRNWIVQGTGMGMVVLMLLAVLPAPGVLGWALVAIAAVAAEDQCLRIVAQDGKFAADAARAAPLLRVLTTTIYALAALVLIAKGDGGERLFAFSLISASMIYVLMRYYRSPVILVASIAPYGLVMVLIGFGLTRTALQQGHLLGALASLFTIAMFGIQFWSARAQLSSSWTELMAAREEAEARERCAEAANRAKSQFLATMSHELRTPLNGVLGMAQALTAERLTQTQQERVKVIRRSSESLLAVLNDLLDLSKIESSVLELEVVEFDLEHLVRGVAAAYRPPAERKGLTFEFEIADAAAGRYLGDSARLRRVLYSLCDNAVKFTDAGGVTLRVTASGPQDGTDVVFEVADTGIGIRPDDLPHLFEGFFQADGTHTRQYGGIGIGLAICHELTTLMAGSVGARSTPGEGSVFTLRLPLAPAEPLETPKATEPRLEEAERPAELRVLAAEDNATNQLVLKTLLAQAGVVPTIAGNGREALAAWESQTWDIVLMDIQMPEMDGLEATRAIRRREQETGRARTPIVAVTANAMTHQVTEYEAAGMDGMVAKPIDIAALFNAIEEALTLGEAPACQDAFTA
jgi:signal transduction histidine kinase/ActR/RegA family two-component response regulator